MKKIHKTNVRLVCFVVATVAVAAGLSGCFTVHTASILAHDSLRFPTVALDAGETVSEGGLVVKTTPTWSELDDAYTHSVQGGYVHSVVIPLDPSVRLSLAGGASGYYARNILSGVFEGTEEETRSFDGYGFTGQFKPSFFFGSRAARFMAGGNFVYNREFGEYLAFRNTFDVLNADPTGIFKRLDYSPHGQTLQAAMHYGFAYRFDQDRALLAETGTGILYTDFIYDNSNTLTASSATLTYTGKQFWVWVGGEWLAYLNKGISVGAGLRLR